MYDLLLKNGTVVDGSGKPRFQADVAVTGDKIAAVRKDIPAAEAKTVLDVTGLIVAPGFIDWHSHSDLTVLMNFDSANILEQGITLEIAGHCGVSIAPFNGKASAVGYLAKPEQVEEMKAAGGTYKAYLDELKKMPMPTNIASFIGHGTLRDYVMGYDNRKPTDEEMARMKDVLRRVMEDGAMGLSSGLIYPPGNYSTPEELEELCAVVAEFEDGMYTSHMRSEGDRVVESVIETINVAEKAHLPVVISHHKIAGRHNKGKSVETLRLIEEAKAKGLTVYLDQYPYDGGATSLMSALPPKYASGGMEKLVEQLKDPAVRAEITETLKKPGTDFENLIYGSTLEGVIIDSEKKPEINGLTLVELGEREGKDPYEDMYDLMVEVNGEVGAIYRMISMWDMENILAYKNTMGGIDGGQMPKEMKTATGHPRGVATFPKLIGEFCRDRKFYSLEECVNRFTGQAAEAARFADKGNVAEGKDADLVVFDFDTIAGRADYGCADIPNEGIKYVFVNGVMSVEDGVVTGKMGGKVLLRSGKEY